MARCHEVATTNMKGRAQSDVPGHKIKNFDEENSRWNIRKSFGRVVGNHGVYPSFGPGSGRRQPEFAQETYAGRQAPTSGVTLDPHGPSNQLLTRLTRAYEERLPEIVLGTVTYPLRFERLGTPTSASEMEAWRKWVEELAAESKSRLGYGFEIQYPASEMREHEVSTYINNVKHEGQECFGAPTPRPVNPVVSKPKKGADPDQLGLGF